MPMNEDVLKQKKLLRRKMINWRELINSNNRVEWNRLICNNILSLPEFNDAEYIAGYIAFKGEVNLTTVLETGLRYDKKVVLPVTDAVKHIMIFRQIFDLTTLVNGGYGILEPPSQNNIINISQINCVIVPGVAFSSKGARLGYGGGYYDSILSYTNCPKIAVAFSGQILDDIPTDETDILMDYIITEKDILKFN